MPTVHRNRTPAADILRSALDPDDRDRLGIRDAGPLDWTPSDEPQKSTRVELGRLTQLARRKIARDDHRRRATRSFTEVAA